MLSTKDFSDCVTMYCSATDCDVFQYVMISKVAELLKYFQMCMIFSAGILNEGLCSKPFYNINNHIECEYLMFLQSCFTWPHEHLVSFINHKVLN